jgi:hypothetical protein
VTADDEIRDAAVAAVVAGLSSGELDVSTATARMLFSLWAQLEASSKETYVQPTLTMFGR